ncbi:hypothetical protein [Phormidesmis priestleyi]|nr:hypothetical protein [Phormidesmis priestleyi]
MSGHINPAMFDLTFQIVSLKAEEPQFLEQFTIPGKAAGSAVNQASK